MSDSLSINPIQPFAVSVIPPGSKSLTNRALVLAAMADGVSTLTGVLFSDDTCVMMAALQQLGIRLEIDDETCTVVVHGCGGTLPTTEPPGAQIDLNLGNSGTTIRFLTAACCLFCKEHRMVLLDGIPRMRERPIGELCVMLQNLGAAVVESKNEMTTVGGEMFPPILVESSGIDGGEINVKPTLSSQYISAVLQVAPYCEKGATLNFDGAVTSRPYVEMTLGLMHSFGVSAEVDQEFKSIRVSPGTYKALDYLVEPDASNASYFLAAAAVVPGSKCSVEGLGKLSLQGDVGFADLLHKMGAGLLFGGDFITIIGPPEGEKLKGIDVDLNDMPDMAQTLAVVALFADGPTTMRNIGNLRVKETDRMDALKNELTKLGATITIDGDDMTIEPPSNNELKPAAIDTYDDHRMAMSFAVAGLRSPGVTINDPGCVAKTFPHFFDYLAQFADSPAK